MLSIVILTPLLGALTISTMPDYLESQKEHVKQAALVISLGTFAVTGIVYLSYDQSQGGYQLVSGPLGVDGISIWFVLLTGALTPICLVASWANVGLELKRYMVAQLAIEGLLISVFLVSDLFFFYVAFESVLMPLFMLLGVWGGSVTRQRSSMLLFLYTLAGSLFMLLSLLGILGKVGTIDFEFLLCTEVNPLPQLILWIGISIALAVKTPLAPFHIWLPRAHADAPLAGSMVLAGTVLKLATYGYLRVTIPMLPEATGYLAPTIGCVAVVTLLYSSMATVRQGDVKALVAYSSVAHMAVVVIGLFSNVLMGIEGAVLLSLAHGVVSPALFMLVGGVLYDRYHRRTIEHYRGLASSMPLFSTFFFIAVCCNMGVPLSLNWAGELMALAGAFQQSPMVGVLGATGIIFSACYSIWLWSRLVGGDKSKDAAVTCDVTRRETVVLVFLLAPALAFGVYPNGLLPSLHLALGNILYTVLPLPLP